MRAFLSLRFWAAHLLTLLAVAASILLGIWQLHVWQAGRAASALDLTQAAPKQLDRVMGGDDPFPGRELGQPVTFRGTWLGDDTMYVADRELAGQRGYWVVTPVLTGGSAMPVVRGWTPRAEAPAVSGATVVTGWLQASEGTGAVDDDPGDDILPEMRVASLVQHVDADLYSAFVVSSTDDGADGLSPVTPESIPEISSTDHLRNLLYAFQWWLFGGLAVYMWWRWIRDQLEAEEAEEVDEVGQPAPA